VPRRTQISPKSLPFPEYPRHSSLAKSVCKKLQLMADSCRLWRYVEWEDGQLPFLLGPRPSAEIVLSRACHLPPVANNRADFYVLHFAAAFA
jgi:hypothetical protein